MMGHCTHGDFVLKDGCPKCIEERRVGLFAKSLLPKPSVPTKEVPFTIPESQVGGPNLFAGNAPGPFDQKPEANSLAAAAKAAGAEVTEVNLFDQTKQTVTVPVPELGPDVIIDKAFPSFGPEPSLFPGMLSAEETTIMKTRPDLDQDAIKLYLEAIQLKVYAEQRVITDAADLEGATADLVIIRKLRKAFDGKRKEWVKPIKDCADSVNKRLMVMLLPIDEADRITSSKMIEFNREQAHIRAEQEKINSMRVEAARKEAELIGSKPAPVEMVEVIPEPEKFVRTDAGGAGMRNVWKWRLTDIKLVPREYLKINEGMVTPVVKASRGQIEIPGIEIYNDPIEAVGGNV